MNTENLSLRWFLTLLTVLISGVGTRPCQATPTLKVMFEESLSAEGETYFVLRSNIVAAGAAAIPFLAAKTESSNLTARVVAAAALGWIGEPETNKARQKLLSEMLREASRSRAGALRIIQWSAFGVPGADGPIQPRDVLHGEPAVPFLLEAALKGCSSATLEGQGDHRRLVLERCMACALVGGYPGRDVLPVLKELFASRSVELRISAATGLRRTKTMEGTELLIRGLGDEVPEVRRACRAGLIDLTDRDFNEDKKKYEIWWEENVQRWPFNDRVPGQKRIFLE